MRRDIQEIFRATPHSKQVMMFSATLSRDIRPVCKKFMQDVIIRRSSRGWRFLAVFMLSLPSHGVASRRAGRHTEQICIQSFVTALPTVSTSAAVLWMGISAGQMLSQFGFFLGVLCHLLRCHQCYWPILPSVGLYHCVIMPSHFVPCRFFRSTFCSSFPGRVSVGSGSSAVACFADLISGFSRHCSLLRFHRWRCRSCFTPLHSSDLLSWLRHT